MLIGMNRCVQLALLHFVSAAAPQVQLKPFPNTSAGTHLFQVAGAYVYVCFVPISPLFWPLSNQTSSCR